MNNQNWNYTLLAIVGYLAFLALTLFSFYYFGRLLGTIIW
jgi:hypothetical protein